MTDFENNCLKHRKKLEILFVSGVLEQRNGQITLHFDSDSNLRRVERNDLLFVAEKSKI